MEPTIWGPFMWFILHIITFNYPDEPTIFIKESYRDFFISLKNVIPCDHCSKHYAKHIQNYPITPHLDNKKKLIEWLIYIHNKVNISLGKRTYTINEVLDTYEKIDPISPFAIQSLDVKNKITETYNKSKFVEENFKKKNKILYTFIVISIIIILIINVINKKNYYDY